MLKHNSTYSNTYIFITYYSTNTTVDQPITDHANTVQLLSIHYSLHYFSLRQLSGGFLEKEKNINRESNQS